VVSALDFGILSNSYKFRTMINALFFRHLKALVGDFLSKMLRLFSKIVHGLGGQYQG